jgi:hypothetical protein
MKAITIWQPFASLIIAGAKPFEFRSWKPPKSLIGERIVIHASARKPETSFSRTRRLMSPDVCKLFGIKHRSAVPVIEKALDQDETLLGHGDLPWGCGLGTALLGEPRPIDEVANSEFHVRRLVYANTIVWAWPLLGIEQWKYPIVTRGYQGFWNWPEPDDFSI